MAALRGPVWLAKVIWYERIYKPLRTYRQSTRPWRRRVHSKYIQPLWQILKCVGSVVWFICEVLGWLVLGLLAVLGLPFVPFIWVGRMECMQPVRSMVLKTLAYGFLGLVLILRLLWWPVKRVGTLIYGDPDWDWILLWNVTILFPKYFPRNLWNAGHSSTDSPWMGKHQTSLLHPTGRDTRGPILR